MGSRALGLARACHPGPAVAVTLLGGVLFASAGNTAARTLLGVLTVLTGQLSIGWSNDLIDGARDTAVGRVDKPLAAGEIDRTLLGRAVLLALVVTVPASLALGWRAGLVHLVAVASGWLYNLWLKSTPVSPLPYLVAFGALPAIATLALPEPRWPSALLLLAAGLIGAGAHFGNVLPDLPDDVATGVLGLPHRIGAPASAVSAAVLVLAATALVLLGPGHRCILSDLIAPAAVLALVAYGLRPSLAVRRSATAFRATMLCAAIDVALIAVRGGLG